MNFIPKIKQKNLASNYIVDDFSSNFQLFLSKSFSFFETTERVFIERRARKGGDLKNRKNFSFFWKEAKSVSNVTVTTAFKEVFQLLSKKGVSSLSLSPLHKWFFAEKSILGANLGSTLMLTFFLLVVAN